MKKYGLLAILFALFCASAATAETTEKTTGRVGAILYGAEEGVASFQVGDGAYSVGGLYCAAKSAQWVRVVTLAKQNGWRLEVTWTESSVPPEADLPPIRCVQRIEAL